MKCVRSIKEPTLVGIIEYPEDFKFVCDMVDHMNQELIDSGYDQYSSTAKQVGKKLYIEKD